MRRDGWSYAAHVTVFIFYFVFPEGVGPGAYETGVGFLFSLIL